MSDCKDSSHAQKKKYLTTTQAARRIGCSPPTVRKMLREGKLSGFRIGSHVRFTVEDIDAAIGRIRFSAAESEGK
jgi:excisionase family DNA binding protein